MPVGALGARPQRAVAGDRTAGRPGGPLRAAPAALAAGAVRAARARGAEGVLAARGAVLREVRQFVAARLAATRVGGPGAAAQRARGQRLGDVEGAGAAAVPGGHGAAGGAGQARAVRLAGGAPWHAHGADHATGAGAGATGRAPGALGTRAGARRARGGAGTAGVLGPVGTRAALGGRARLAGREPVAGLLLGRGRGLRGGLGGGRGRGRGAHLGRGLVVPGGLGGLAVTHGLAHDDRWDGPGPGDVDPDPGRQRGLGLAFLGLRARTARVRTVAGSHGGPVRRGAGRVCGSAAPVGPGGRSVSFTTQGRFSQLAPPPDTDLTASAVPPTRTRSRARGRLGGAHHHTGRPWRTSPDR